MARFVISDIHGAHKALVQCLERSKFDRDKDLLICLGDVCDGYANVPESFEELLTIKNLVYILGNHDVWCLEWAISGNTPGVWLDQGGHSTIKSYNGSFNSSHFELLKGAKQYHIIDNMMFVHGGFEPNKPLEEQNLETFVWDRSLVFEAYQKNVNKKNVSGFDKVFVGHTPSLRFNSFSPVKFCEVTLTDTGAGWGKKLSIINIDNGEFFQSDETADLYPVNAGR